MYTWETEFLSAPAAADFPSPRRRPWRTRCSPPSTVGRSAARRCRPPVGRRSLEERVMGASDRPMCREKAARHGGLAHRLEPGTTQKYEIHCFHCGGFHSTGNCPQVVKAMKAMNGWRKAMKAIVSLSRCGTARVQGKGWTGKTVSPLEIAFSGPCFLGWDIYTSAAKVEEGPERSIRITDASGSQMVVREIPAFQSRSQPILVRDETMDASAWGETPRSREQSGALGFRLWHNP